MEMGLAVWLKKFQQRVDEIGVSDDQLPEIEKSEEIVGVLPCCMRSFYLAYHEVAKKISSLTAKDYRKLERSLSRLQDFQPEEDVRQWILDQAGCRLVHCTFWQSVREVFLNTNLDDRGLDIRRGWLVVFKKSQPSPNEELSSCSGSPFSLN